MLGVFTLPWLIGKERILKSLIWHHGHRINFEINFLKNSNIYALITVVIQSLKQSLAGFKP